MVGGNCEACPKSCMKVPKIKVFPTDDTGKALGEFRLNVSGSGYSIIYEDRQIAVRPCKGTRSGSYSLNYPDDNKYFKN